MFVMLWTWFVDLFGEQGGEEEMRQIFKSSLLYVCMSVLYTTLTDEECSVPALSSPPLPFFPLFFWESGREWDGKAFGEILTYLLTVRPFD